jgi:hypothetical protein
LAGREAWKKLQYGKCLCAQSQATYIGGFVSNSINFRCGGFGIAIAKKIIEKKQLTWKGTS